MYVEFIPGNVWYIYEYYASINRFKEYENSKTIEIYNS